jgi:voltage-dependent potassium channel beta subunit
MHYRRLGDAGMKVSAVSIGSWINFEEGKSLGDDARQIIARAYELGVNFFDTADAYGNGSAERQLGEMLKPFPRHTLVVSTKLFRDMSDDVNDRGLSRKHIMESIDKSLQRLQMDYIDIYFCHRADPETPMLETARAMDDLIHKGKILYWGTSEWDAKDLEEALRVCEKYNLHKPQTDQPQYSLLFRQRVEQEILPLTEPAGIGLVPYSPLAYGLLTGKYDDGIPDDSRFAKEPWAKNRMLTAEAVEKVRRLKPIADRLGLTRAQLALAWLLRQPGVSSAITGATKIAQIEENAQAADITLAPDVLAEIDAIFPAGVPA